MSKTIKSSATYTPLLSHSVSTTAQPFATVTAHKHSKTSSRKKSKLFKTKTTLDDSFARKDNRRSSIVGIKSLIHSIPTNIPATNSVYSATDSQTKSHVRSVMSHHYYHHHRYRHGQHPKKTSTSSPALAVGSFTSSLTSSQIIGITLGCLLMVMIMIGGCLFMIRKRTKTSVIENRRASHFYFMTEEPEDPSEPCIPIRNENHPVNSDMAEYASVADAATLYSPHKNKGNDGLQTSLCPPRFPTSKRNMVRCESPFDTMSLGSNRDHFSVSAIQLFRSSYHTAKSTQPESIISSLQRKQASGICDSISLPYSSERGSPVPQTDSHFWDLESYQSLSPRLSAREEVPHKY